MDRKRLRKHLAIKRIFDIVASLLGIVLFLPVWIVVPVVIRRDSEGPVFFRQRRLTKNGRVFLMYKFRTMVQGAEKKGTGLFNYENDPRVTKAGRFLRDTSLDELPQLFNVLKGDISLVGPRPPVEYELGDYETLNRKYKKRFRVPGGITGLAQVRGRNENSWEEKVALDNRYIDEFREKGVRVDAEILFRTLAGVFRRSNIYEEKVDGAGSDAESAKLAEEEVIRRAHLPDREERNENGNG